MILEWNPCYDSMEINPIGNYNNLSRGFPDPFLLVEFTDSLMVHAQPSGKTMPEAVSGSPSGSTRGP
jgi:hypothetical protein